MHNLSIINLGAPTVITSIIVFVAQLKMDPTVTCELQNVPISCQSGRFNIDLIRYSLLKPDP